MNPRKIEVEIWRDSQVSIPGEIDRKLGGESTDSIMNNPRRSLYATMSRSGERLESDSFFRLFDFPQLKRPQKKAFRLPCRSSISSLHPRRCIDQQRCDPEPQSIRRFEGSRLGPHLGREPQGPVSVRPSQQARTMTAIQMASTSRSYPSVSCIGGASNRRAFETDGRTHFGRRSRFAGRWCRWRHPCTAIAGRHYRSEAAANTEWETSETRH